MDGVTFLQEMPGPINILPTILCLILGIMGLLLIIGAIVAIIEGDSELFTIIIPGAMLIICSIFLGFSIHNDRLTPENHYSYVTIEDNVTMNEFFKHYDLIDHKPNSSLWLIKEKDIKTEEN